LKSLFLAVGARPSPVASQDDRMSPRHPFAWGKAVPQRSRRILPLIVVALASAAAGGWIATAAFDGRAQVLAADMAVKLSRTLSPGGRGPAPPHLHNPDRPFRVERSAGSARG
jgi:hypothetical protein